MLPAFVRGFPDGDDASENFRWATEFIDALREGVIYPRWLGTANDGQGSPAMLYYPPLIFYVTAAFNAVLGDTLKALVFSCWLGLALSGMAMFLFSRSFLPRWISLIAAAFYMIAPYHIFDLYQRSALSEFWSFAWVPLVLHAASRIAEGRGWSAVPYLAISYAALLLTHLPISLALTLILPIYALVLTRNVRELTRFAAGLVLGVSISALFVLPVLVERRYVRTEILLNYDYRNYFLFRGLSKAFKMILLRSDNQPRFYIVEATSLMAMALLILLISSGLLLWNMQRSGWHSLLGRRSVQATFVIAAFSLFMTTPLSAPIWQVVPQLRYMPFPFRWLVIATASTVVFTAIAVSAMTHRSKLAILCASLIGIVLISSLRISVLAIDRITYDQEAIKKAATGMEVPEYRPVWMKKRKDWEEGKHDELRQLGVLVDSGDASVRAISDAGIRQSYMITASTESVLRFRPLYFPGWTASVDGNSLEVAPSIDGNIQLRVGSGEHTLMLRFEDTWPRSAGKIISCLGLLISLSMLYAARSKP